MFSWYRQVSKGERYTFWACFGGWALDALDVQMFSLVIPAIIAEWGISKTQAGLVSGVTLVASALGGWICGAAADRYGRVKTLQVTVVFFSVFTLLSAFAQNYPQFIVLKALQGFGFGGEWAAGAVLMAETIRNEHRGKAMGAVQSAWAVGWAAAVLLYATVFSFMSPDIGWRVGFCYNFGRVVSAGFPVMVGHLASQYSLGFAIGVDAVFAYAIVAVSVMMLPETRGRTLAEDVPA